MNLPSTVFQIINTYCHSLSCSGEQLDSNTQVKNSHCALTGILSDRGPLSQIKNASAMITDMAVEISNPELLWQQDNTVI